MDKRLREVRLQRVPTAAKLGAIADEIEDSTPVKRIKGIKHNFGDPQTPVVPPISADNAARVKTIYLIFPRIRRTATQSNKEAQLRQMSRYPISFERTRRKLRWATQNWPSSRERFCMILAPSQKSSSINIAGNNTSDDEVNDKDSNLIKRGQGERAPKRTIEYFDDWNSAVNSAYADDKES